jgi:Kef-type K+ transport system membrane component KefB
MSGEVMINMKFKVSSNASDAPPAVGTSYLAHVIGLQLGSLMNTRGLMELIALNIGYDLGILSPRLFTMLVIMALVTTMLTGPLLTLFGKQGLADGKIREPSCA